MARYKNIELDDRLRNVIRHMYAVEEYREVLQGLQSAWDNLTLLGQLSGAGTDMSSTRQAFNQLTSSLLNQLGSETLKKSIEEMAAKAQVAIDILVRNLFERTADIGFLATDEDVRQFVTAAAQKGDRFSNDIGMQRSTIRARFAEYVAKYSVYSDIVLLDTSGKVLARLDESVTVAHSADPLIHEALKTTAAYVETYRHHDLLPGQPVSLGYSFRVVDDRDQPIGVLFLCFRFENEMERIFSNLAAADDWSVITLIDHEGRIVASSDRIHVPVGAVLKPILDKEYQIVRFGSQEYLATTRQTQGFQGYQGPGWYGHVMLPVQYAFNNDSSGLLSDVSPEVLSAMMGSPALFGEELRSIPVQAERIQSDLNRSVWNGNVSLDGARQSINPTFSKILLREISNTGSKTKDVFERSIANLHETVVSAILQDSQFLASLAIEIMDRNLYERANDCRWWALTSAFREILAAKLVDVADVQKLGGILRHINELYTVYSNLILFDAKGRVIAVSNLDAAALVDQTLEEEWVQRVLGLKDSQDYAVSDFTATPLYNGRHTYIYGAAVQAPGRKNVVGGIGIVFDAEVQFASILRDALPASSDNSEKIPGAFAVFVDRQGQVIACSDDKHYMPGACVSLEGDYLALKAGEASTGVVKQGGHYYAVGARMSFGYREYKSVADSYRNDVIALVFLPLCDVAEQAQNAEASRLLIRSDRGIEAETVEISTFHIGATWFGLQSDCIVEAVEPIGMSFAPRPGSAFAGYLMYRGIAIAVCDIAAMANTSLSGDVKKRQVIVLRRGHGSQFGILADGLGEIVEIATSRLHRFSPMPVGGKVPAEAVVSTDDKQLLQMLSVERILACLNMSGAEMSTDSLDVSMTNAEASVER